MFVDVCHYTTISEMLEEKHDPGVLMDMLNTFFECIMHVVSEYGGEVTKLIGEIA